MYDVCTDTEQWRRKMNPKMHAELLTQSLATPPAHHETPAAVAVGR